MAFTVFEKVWDNTGKGTVGAYTRDTMDDAISTFHKKMGADMNPEIYSAALVMCYDDDGAVYRSEKWVSPVPPVTPEPTPEPEPEEE